MLDVLTLDGLDWKSKLHLSAADTAFGSAEAAWCDRAYDHRRMASVVARWSGGHPILVVTFAGLAEAHAHAGPEATALDVLQVLGAMQGLPAEGLPWQSIRAARDAMSSVLAEARDGRAFASPRLGLIFMSADGYDGAPGQGVAEPWPYLHADRILLHEVGHILQHVHRMIFLWKDCPFEARRTKRSIASNLLSILLRHHKECFAEAFSCLALMASGVPRPFIEEASARLSAGVNVGLAWRLAFGMPDTPAARAEMLVYQTFAAEALAMREATPHGLAAVLEGARRIAGRGALGPDMFLRMLDGEERPEWFADFDPKGLKARKADERRALELWPHGIDSMLTVLGTIDDPTARYQRRMGMAEVVHRRWRFARPDWTALQEISAKPLEAWMAPLVQRREEPPCMAGPLDLAA